MSGEFKREFPSSPSVLTGVFGLMVLGGCAFFGKAEPNVVVVERRSEASAEIPKAAEMLEQGASPPLPLNELIGDGGQGGNVGEVTGRESIRIASFYLHRSGGEWPGSAPKSLALFARDYDVVALQGLPPEENLEGLFADLRADPELQIVISEESGREEEDRSTRERYAFIVRSAVVQFVGQPILFADERFHLFRREPLLARFKIVGGELSFVIISAHLELARAREELESLSHAVTFARVFFEPEKNVVVLGNLYADCDGMREDEELHALSVYGLDFFWVVPDTADTFVPEARCTYDRIVLAGELPRFFSGKWGVAEEPDLVELSDHLPVWAELLTRGLTDN